LAKKIITLILITFVAFLIVVNLTPIPKDLPQGESYDK